MTFRKVQLKEYYMVSHHRRPYYALTIQWHGEFIRQLKS